MAYLRRTEAPHRHVLPSGYDYSSPANDRKCFGKNGGHLGTETVKCGIGDCEHSIGTLCTKCEKVV